MWSGICCRRQGRPTGPALRRGEWIATINLRGLRRGVYAARVTARADGRRVTCTHLYQVLFGNPRGGKEESLNSHVIVRL